MTETVDTAPATEPVDPLCAVLEDDLLSDDLLSDDLLTDGLLDDGGWVEAEFNAIIAANWDAEPPEPDGPSTGLPRRWDRPRRSRRTPSRQRLVDQVAARSRQRRQRSPPGS
jgi:hypothetical protein